VTEPSTGDGVATPEGQVPRAEAAVCYRHPDREAHIRCVRCERRICPDCMVPAAVGFQCPECVRQGNTSVRQARTVFGGRVTQDPGWVSKVLIGINVVVFVLQNTVTGFTSRYYDIGAFPPPPFEARIGVAAGEYYRLLTSAFMHANLLHIALNMYALYLFGPPVEAALGRVRFAALYLVAALGGSAVSYAFASPVQPSLGASGAIFGLLGAFLVINRRLGRDTSGVIALLLINLAFGFLVPRIDWRAHLGGLIFGALCAAVIAYAPARPASRRTAVQVAGLIGAALLVVVIVVLRTAQLQG
jgi:membrane associated rhomboid family serine protease